MIKPYLQIITGRGPYHRLKKQHSAFTVEESYFLAKQENKTNIWTLLMFHVAKDEQAISVYYVTIYSIKVLHYFWHLAKAKSVEIKILQLLYM